MAALTLADSFLNDLDELEEEEENNEEEEDELVPTAETMMQPVSDEVADFVKRKTRMRESERYARHMQSIEDFEIRNDTKEIVAEDEYAIIVESNEILRRIEDELSRVHRFVVERYSKKFPELETLVPEKLDYVKVVMRMRNEMDMTQVDLSDILPPSAVMVVSVTGSTTTGTPLDTFAEILDDCQECLELDSDRSRILAYLESRMATIAPNTTALVGTSLTAMLIGAAGGLEKLAAVPACNLTCLGQNKKRDLAGFGAEVAMPHTGILYFADLVQAAPPPLRRKVLKIVAAKTALCARVDAHRGKKKKDDISTAEAMIKEVKAKIELLCAPPKARQVKALPAPDIASTKTKRGGKRVRKAKDKLRVTELRGLANKRAFGRDFGTEYGDDAMGNDFGLMGQEGAGVRAPAQQKSSLSSKQHNNKKQRTAVQLSSSAVSSGLASSLVFTPVQGIELAANPATQQAKLDAANAKWFSAASGFQSALVTNKGADGGLTF